MPKSIEVRFTVSVPDEATSQQIQDWLDKNLGDDDIDVKTLGALRGVSIDAEPFSVNFKD